MKRRLFMLVGTFLLLILACVVYYFVAGSGEYRHDRDDSTPGDFTVPQTADEEFEGKALVFTDRNRKGQLQGIYTLPDWKKRPDGSYAVTRPKVILYQRDGQELIIQADQGTVYAQELADSANVRRGTLKGNVRLIYDRATSLDRRPREDRPEDLIRFYTDKIEFNNDLLQITTDSHVTIFSAECDILGEGLLIRWNDNPRELRTLKILAGEYLAIKEVPKEFSLVPQGGGRARTTLKGSPVAEPLGGEERLELLDEPDALSFEPTRQLTSAGAAASTRAVPASGPATAPATLPAKTPATAPPETVAAVSKAVRGNVYKATFHGRVQVDSGNGSIHGADRVAMVFEWDSSQRRSFRFGRDANTSPTTAPTTRPAARPRDKQKQLSEAVVITWTGPLILEPIGYTPTPSQERFRIAAEGEDLVLFDKRIRAGCQHLLYFHPERSGQLTGGEDNPVRVQSDANEEVICEQLRFDGRRNLVHLPGPGYIAARGDGSFDFKAGVIAQATAKPATRPTTAPVTGNRIAWAESVTARFATVTVRGDDGKTADQTVVTEAIFRGGVTLSGRVEGDFVRGEKLHVWLDEDTQGQFPRKAIVSGNVSGHQQDTDILAEKVTIFFEETFEVDSDGEMQRRIEPNSIIAEDNVRVTIRDGNEVTTAAADRIVTDVRKDTAKLFGKPAVVTQGDRKIGGSEIRLIGSSKSVRVEGSGEMAFITDRDFDGGRLETPQPVEITWTGGMDFDGKGKVANFIGPVKFTSGLNSIQCRDRMRVAFVETRGEGASGPAGQPRPERGMRGAAFEMAGFGRLRLASVLAVDDVIVLTRREDSEKNMLQRLQLKTDHLFYNAIEAQIGIFEPGILLVEDYRPPKSFEREGFTDANARPVDVGRPWQTYFEWRKQMQLMLDSREVFMDGQIAMVHRSAGHVKRPGGLKLLPWPEMADGRTTTLGCDELQARFAPPDKTPTPRPAGQTEVFDSGAVLGDIELFIATRDVILKDGEWELRGMQLSYHRSPGVAYLWGYMKGEGARQAVVSQENPITGVSRIIRSPKFNCYLDGRHIKKVEAAKVTGASGR